jgi:hypothetical protein
LKLKFGANSSSDTLRGDEGRGVEAVEQASTKMPIITGRTAVSFKYSALVDPPYKYE